MAARWVAPPLPLLLWSLLLLLPSLLWSLLLLLLLLLGPRPVLRPRYRKSRRKARKHCMGPNHSRVIRYAVQRRCETNEARAGLGGGGALTLERRERRERGGGAGCPPTADLAPLALCQLYSGGIGPSAGLTSAIWSGSR